MAQLVAFPNVFHHLWTPVVGLCSELCPSFCYPPCLSALVILSLQALPHSSISGGCLFPTTPVLAGPATRTRKGGVFFFFERWVFMH